MTSRNTRTQISSCRRRCPAGSGELELQDDGDPVRRGRGVGDDWPTEARRWVAVTADASASTTARAGGRQHSVENETKVATADAVDDEID